MSETIIKRFLIVDKIMGLKRAYLPLAKYLRINAREKGTSKGYSFPDMKSKTFKVKEEIRLRSELPYGYSTPLIKVDGVFSFPAVRKIEGEVLEKLEKMEEEIKELTEKKNRLLVNSFGELPVLTLEECYDFLEEGDWKEKTKEKVKRILERRKK